MYLVIGFAMWKRCELLISFLAEILKLEKLETGRLQKSAEKRNKWIVMLKQTLRRSKSLYAQELMMF